MMYEYKVKILEVHDGDTVHAAIDLGFGVTFVQVLRLYGINAPELSTPEGLAAKQFLVDTAPSIVRMISFKDRKEKYGRYLATLADDQDRNINGLMVQLGYAKPYFGVGPK